MAYDTPFASGAAPLLLLLPPPTVAAAIAITAIALSAIN
jgi:hypothetical protein